MQDVHFQLGELSNPSLPAPIQYLLWLWGRRMATKYNLSTYLWLHSTISEIAIFDVHLTGAPCALADQGLAVASYSEPWTSPLFFYNPINPEALIGEQDVSDMWAQISENGANQVPSIAAIDDIGGTLVQKSDEVSLHCIQPPFEYKKSRTSSHTCFMVSKHLEGRAIGHSKRMYKYIAESETANFRLNCREANRAVSRSPFPYFT
ncbi:hypothetical protein BJ508DRAFT_300462 [Ascobolus immersus RN42]|uniref:Uncharacterized protein n=1 Tax=Ascobolus immersus RN42 TaxID=1160509 RepID=A0A3N4IV42_ASCIM|nr:hypothetical protein BJ508DRAFT_300462 [Ascobolus immersus RN42]